MTKSSRTAAGRKLPGTLSAVVVTVKTAEGDNSVGSGSCNPRNSVVESIKEKGAALIDVATPIQTKTAIAANRTRILNDRENDGRSKLVNNDIQTTLLKDLISGKTTKSSPQMNLERSLSRCVEDRSEDLAPMLTISEEKRGNVSCGE